MKTLLQTNPSAVPSLAVPNRIHNFNKKIKYNAIVYLRSLTFQYCTPQNGFRSSRRRTKSRKRNIHFPALSPMSLLLILLWSPCSTTNQKMTYDNYYNDTKMWTNMVFKYSYTYNYIHIIMVIKRTRYPCVLSPSYKCVK